MYDKFQMSTWIILWRIKCAFKLSVSHSVTQYDRQMQKSYSIKDRDVLNVTTTFWHTARSPFFQDKMISLC